MIKRSSLLFLSLICTHFLQTCDANCTPFACGIISNISSPFRLKGDPKNCGDRRFELACENDVSSIDLNSHKYYVKEINYENSSIRVVDASINNDDVCSFPIYSTYEYNFTNNNPYPYQIPRNSSYTTPISLMRCPHPLNNSSFFTEVAADCERDYTYIKVGHLNASEVTETCGVELVVMTSWEFKDLNNVSLSEIHDSLLYGFELTICPKCTQKLGKFLAFFYGLIPTLVVIVGLLCAVVSPPVFTIVGFAALSLLLYRANL